MTAKQKSYLPLGLNTFQCSICTDLLPFSSRFAVPNCNHSQFCMNCIREYFIQNLDVRKTVKCPVRECRVHLSTIVLKSVLGKKYEEIVRQPPAPRVLDGLKADDAFNVYATMSDGKYCSKCHHFIERTFGCNHMQCVCGYQFCYECGLSSHSGSCFITPQAMPPIVDELRIADDLVVLDASYRSMSIVQRVIYMLRTLVFSCVSSRVL
jgi:hypothetical protein